MVLFKLLTLTAVPGLAQDALQHHRLFGCGEFRRIGVFEARGSQDLAVVVVIRLLMPRRLVIRGVHVHQFRTDIRELVAELLSLFPFSD